MGWRKVKFNFRFVTEVVTQRIEEARLCVQTRNFVLVFVTQQFEIATSNSIRQTAITVVRFVSFANAINHQRITLSEFLVLIIDQKLGPTFYNLVEAFVPVGRVFTLN